MSTVMIWCLVRSSSSAFYVKIKNDDFIIDLKEAISNKLSNDVKAIQLTLWKVNINQSQIKTTTIDSMLNNENKLENSGVTVGKAFLSIEGNNVRVIVEVAGQPVGEPPKKRVKLDDGKLNEFWRALKNASCKKFLILSENTRFLGNEYGPSALLIRECYRDLQKVVFDSAIQKLRITGNPGIGKTFFGYYLLYLLALQNATIVYDNHNKDDPIVFEGGKYAFTSSKKGIKPYLRNPSVWYIVDGKEPKSVNAKTILICSPKMEHYTHFDKYHNGVVTIRYMPIWNWKEIKQCRKKLYEHKVERSLARDLFLKWGGIPWFVLKNAKDVTHQKKLDGAIKTCDREIFDYVGESCIERTKTSHMIVHIHTNLPVKDDKKLDKDELRRYQASATQLQLDRNGKPPYTKATLRFASNYVQEQVSDLLEIRIREKLEKTKAGTGTSLLGNAFEYVAHRILRNGGNFEVRPLDEYDNDDDNDPDAKVELPQQNLSLYFNKANIDVIEDGAYYQPWKRNFPSIDSIIAPNKVFQMTIAKVHSIKMNGLKALYEKFGGKSADHLIYYYFVVPEHLYDDYKVQKIANYDGEDAKIIQGWIEDRVFQYVLKIKL